MHDRRFNPAEAHKLEDPERLKFMPPGEVLSFMDLKPGMRVADIGAGTGYFTLPMAEAVAPDGKVMAVDVSHEMLMKLGAKIANHHYRVFLFEGDASRTGLPDDSCDRVLIANVWHELDDQVAALREAERILRENGNLVIVDWRPNVTRPPGPPLEHRIAPEQVATTFAANGWTVEQSANVGEYSYVVVAHR